MQSRHRQLQLSQFPFKRVLGFTVNTGSTTNGEEAMKSDESPRQNAIAHWVAIASIGFLVYGYIAIALAWIYAAQTNRIPTATDFARYERTGHGPWDHASDLNQFLDHAIVAPFIAAVLAVLSQLLHPKYLTVTLIGVSLVTGLAILYAHFWLLD